MKAHHILMIERDKKGDIVAGHEVPNNEWARCRRKGWDFATAEEKLAYTAMQAEALEEKAARLADRDGAPPDVADEDEGSVTPTSGGWFEVELGDRVEKVQGKVQAEEMLKEMRAEAIADADA
jgi:hypothetical protein